MFNFDYIPEELKKLKNWLLWSEITTEYGFPEILPCDINGRPLKLLDLNTDESLLRPFDDVLKQAIQLNFDGGVGGIGFLITPELPYFLIEFEKVNDSILTRVGSFSEILPENKGVHILVKLKTKKSTDLQFFIFTGKRYRNFTIREFGSIDDVFNLISGDKENVERKENEKNEKDYETHYYSKFIYHDKYYNQIKEENSYSFVVFNEEGNIIESVKELIINEYDKPIKILPAPQIAERKTDLLLQEFGESDPIKFPGYPMDFDRPIDLFNEIRSFIHRYVELKELDEILITIYVIQSSVFDLVKKFTFPLLHVLGPYGRGKTRLLTVLNYIIPYSLYTDDIKAPAVKRVAQLYNPVLVVDEKGQMDSDLRAILNARYNRNAMILNANKEIQKGFAGIIAYRIPGPMILAGREVFNDPAIESKSFQVNMNFELSREDIPRNLKGDILTNFIKDAEIIRAKLMSFRIKYFKKINDLINQEPEWLKEYEKIAEPRLYELISSLSDILNIIPELEQDIRKIIEQQIIENVLVAQETPEGTIAKIFIDIIKDWVNGKEKEDPSQEVENIKEYEINGKKYKGIYLKAIYNEIGENYKQVTGRILSQMGLNTDRPRIKISYFDKNENNNKEKTKRISFVRLPSLKVLLSLFKRYDVEYINMMIKLRKICITEDFEKIDFEKVKKTLDEIDEMDEQKSYTTLIFLFIKLYKSLFDLYENEGYNFLIDNFVQLVQDKIKDEELNLENTESKSKNTYQFFKTEEFYGEKFFSDLGVELIESFDFDNYHYYKLNISKNLKDYKAFNFTSRFSVKAFTISEKEFTKAKEMKSKNDP